MNLSFSYVISIFFRVCFNCLDGVMIHVLASSAAFRVSMKQRLLNSQLLLLHWVRSTKQ